jgi:hypothetical protein
MKTLLTTALIGLLMALATPAMRADIVSYSQDFESLDSSSGSALADDGWLVFANVFTPGGSYLYGYGSFPAPNGGPGFSAIADGEAGPGQGLQYLNVYSDYNNGDHGNGNYIDALVFQEQTIGAGDVGSNKSYEFSFDFRNNPTNANNGDTATYAFIKVLKQSDFSYALLGETVFDTTNVTDWQSQTLSLMSNASWAGELVQFGFGSYATNYNDSGRFYDNVSFAAVPEPTSLFVLGIASLGLTLTTRRRR